MLRLNKVLLYLAGLKPIHIKVTHRIETDTVKKIISFASDSSKRGKKKKKNKNGKSGKVGFFKHQF